MTKTDKFLIYILIGAAVLSFLIALWKMNENSIIGFGLSLAALLVAFYAYTQLKGIDKKSEV